MKRSACLVGMLALVLLSLASAGCGAGNARIHRRYCQGYVRRRAAGRDRRSAEPRARRRGDRGVRCQRGSIASRRCRQAMYEVTARPVRFQDRTRSRTSSLQLGQILKIDVPMPVGGVSEERPGDGRVADHRRQAERRHAEHRVRAHRAHPERPQLHQRADERARAPTRKPRRASQSTARPAPRTATSSTAWTRPTCARASRPSRCSSTSSRKCRSSRAATTPSTGATTGGVVSAITKSGSNAYRGGAGIYYSNDDWAGDVRPAHPPQSREPDARRVHHHAARPGVQRGSGPRPRRTDPPRQGVVLLRLRPAAVSRSERTVTFTAEQPDADVRQRQRRSQPQLQRDVAAEQRNMRVKFAGSNHAQLRRLDAAGERGERHEHCQPDALPESAPHQRD